MTTLHTASRQWATRPDDERFTSLHTMGAKLRHDRDISRVADVASKTLEFLPTTDGGMGMQRKGNTDPSKISTPTHWSFGQFAALGGAPAGYLRKLHPALAADCMNYGLQVNRDVEDVKLLWRINGVNEVAAATGTGYGRVWNTDICDKLIANFGDGVSGDWRVPGEFGKRVEVTKANTTLYASDRDMFIFLADETHRIEMPNRRDGKSGSLARGFFVWNSEVGGGTLGIASFLFDYVCCNRIVWGAEGVKFVKIRHTASAPTRFIDDVRPMLDEYAHGAAKPVEDTIKAAQAAKLSTNVADFLANRRYSAAVIAGMQNAHMAAEGKPMETVWDAVTGMTEYAKRINFQNERVAIERDAGKVLDLVAVR